MTFTNLLLENLGSVLGHLYRFNIKKFALVQQSLYSQFLFNFQTCISHQLEKLFKSMIFRFLEQNACEKFESKCFHLRSQVQGSNFEKGLNG